MRKITTKLCGTNFCTCLARFAPSFVRQPNGPQCTQIEQNTPKLQFRVQWVGSGEFAVKNSDATSCTNFCTSSARFAPSFIMQPNDPQCTQIEQNAPKLQFRVQWVGSGAFVAKNSDGTSCTNLCISSARFAPSFVTQPNGPQCTQIEQNTPV